jgi:hypothetical protein
MSSDRVPPSKLSLEVLMSAARFLSLVLLFVATFAPIASAQSMTVDEFRRELVGVPLCGTPDSGQFAGKMLCTVHLPDGTAILAGAGLVVYGLWEASGGQICRRNAQDPPDKRRCVTYERVDRSHFRNSDGVGFCLGPCEGER